MRKLYSFTVTFSSTPPTPSQPPTTVVPGMLDSSVEAEKADEDLVNLQNELERREWGEGIFRYCILSAIAEVDLIFSDILERNNDYFHTLDFEMERVKELEVVAFCVLEVPDYKPAMLIQLKGSL